ncbi:MAG TPA: hypothetical protein VGM27_06550 [Acidobacteriaceae bacterium]
MAKRKWEAAVFVAVVGFFALIGYELIAVRGSFAPSQPASGPGGTSVLVGTPGDGIYNRLV